MSTVLVTGANRGIGLGLIKEFLKQSEIRLLLATTRNKQSSKDLISIADSRLHILEMDVNDDKSIAAGVKKVGEIVGSAGLELLVNNSGILNSYNSSGPPDRNAALHHFEVNSVGPLIVTQNFLPLLRQGVKSSSAGHARVVTISSGLGSLSLNSGSGPKGFLPYQMSKAAVNQMTRTLSFDFVDENIYFYAFCPGWVQTDMGGKEAFLTVEQSTAALVNSFKQIGKEQNGGFFKKNLEVIPF